MDDFNSFFAGLPAVPNPDPQTGGDGNPGEEPSVPTGKHALEILAHRANLPDGYKPAVPAGQGMLDPRLALEVALAHTGVENAADVFARYGFTAAEDIKRVLENPVFLELLKGYAAEIRDKGLSFRMKARIAAEDLLKQAYALAVNEHVSPSVRADLIKWHAKVADLEPRVDTAGPPKGDGFQLQIVFNTPGAEAQPVTIQGERI